MKNFLILIILFILPSMLLAEKESATKEHQTEKTIIEEPAIEKIEIAEEPAIEKIEIAEEPTTGKPAEVLFSNVPFNAKGGFGGFEIKATKINKNSITLVGGKGAVVFGDNFYFGGGFFASPSRIESNNPEYKDEKFSLGYAGLLFGKMFNPNSLGHFNLEALLAAGTISNRKDKDDEDDDEDSEGKIKDGVAIFDVSVLYEINMFKYSKVSFGLSHRFVGGADKILTNQEASGSSISIAFNFGNIKY